MTLAHGRGHFARAILEAVAFTLKDDLACIGADCDEIRITGGGAVYHDLGNINYSYIGKAVTEGIDFSHFTEPIIGALRSMGVPAELSGRNDILAYGKKISGNAQSR